MECLRFRLSFPGHRISPLAGKYKPPRFIPKRLRTPIDRSRPPSENRACPPQPPPSAPLRKRGEKEGRGEQRRGGWLLSHPTNGSPREPGPAEQKIPLRRECSSADGGPYPGYSFYRGTPDIAVGGPTGGHALVRRPLPRVSAPEDLPPEIRMGRAHGDTNRRE